ncbi:MAG: proteasome accessory factor PafA2 family protein, partial [Patescibacteria group bacterium]
MIAIGAETEHGIIFHSEKLGFVTRSHTLAEEVVGSIVDLYPVFNRTLEGIDDEKEHEWAERILGRSLMELLSLKAPKALVQRYGLSGMIPLNGARYYIDTEHPEYSIPETSNPRDTLIAQKAGDLILDACRKRAEELLRSGKSRSAKHLEHPTAKIQIDRTNSDGKGNSYAGHENYSVSPKTFERIVGDRFFYGDFSGAFMTFLAARQIVTGAGKVGCESGKPIDYQVSARADFIETEINHSTTDFRPIINTRNHPYADEQVIRRLHVICGDSNMSQLS